MKWSEKAARVMGLIHGDEGGRAAHDARWRAAAARQSSARAAWRQRHGCTGVYVDSVPVRSFCASCDQEIGLVKMQKADCWDVHFYCWTCKRRGEMDALTADGRWVRGRSVWPRRLVPHLPTIPVREGHIEPCQICSVLGPVEMHHLAPRAIFGDEAEMWPVVPVCSDCHTRWHRKMR